MDTAHERFWELNFGDQDTIEVLDEKSTREVRRDRRQAARPDFNWIGNDLTHLPDDGVKKAHPRADSGALFSRNQIHHGGFQNLCSVVVVLGCINNYSRP